MDISKSVYIEGLNGQAITPPEIVETKKVTELGIDTTKYLKDLEQKASDVLKKYSETLSNEDKEIVRSMLALALADLQFQADFYYYVRDDNILSSSKIECYNYIKNMSKIFGISGADVEHEALSIYDFNDSGSPNYIPPNYILDALRTAKSIF